MGIREAGEGKAEPSPWTGEVRVGGGVISQEVLVTVGTEGY